jgi:dTDP-4-amino-4,6-dideoxygalactose transaminase
MEGVQGAILRVKLRYLEAWTEARRRNAASYSQVLAGADLILPHEEPKCRHVYHVYGVRTAYRAELQAALNSAGIQTGIHYPFPIHLLAAYADLGYTAGEFPVSEQVALEELSLPMYPELTRSQIEEVARAVVECCPAGISA